MNDDLFSRHHLTIRFERGEKRLVNMLGGNDRIAIFQIARGAGIFGDDDLKAEVRRGTRSGIDAHVSHHAGDDDAFNIPALQQLEQICSAERIGIMFDDQRLAFEVRHGIVNVGAIGAGIKKVAVGLKATC